MMKITDKIKFQFENNILFDPSRWPRRELISRGIAIIIVGVFLYLKFIKFKNYPGFFDQTLNFYQKFNLDQLNILFSESKIKLIWGIRFLTWFIETGILLGYILSYLSRSKAVSVAKGFMETAYPIFIAGLPVLISLTPYNFHKTVPYQFEYYIHIYLAVIGIMLLGGAINLTGLLYLRRAFTIMSEARELITSGIFKYIRHPLYLGHFIIFLGSTILRLHWYTIIMYLVFFFGQCYRAGIEEKKLSNAFDGYAEYKEKAGMFLPGFRKRGRL